VLLIAELWQTHTLAARQSPDLLNTALCTVTRATNCTRQPWHPLIPSRKDPTGHIDPLTDVGATKLALQRAPRCTCSRWRSTHAAGFTLGRRSHSHSLRQAAAHVLRQGPTFVQNQHYSTNPTSPETAKKNPSTRMAGAHFGQHLVGLHWSPSRIHDPRAFFNSLKVVTDVIGLPPSTHSTSSAVPSIKPRDHC